MEFLNRWIIRPRKLVRDIYLGIGSLLLLFSFLAFAGSSFSFDPVLKPQLRLGGFFLASVGGLLWLRGSYPTSTSRVDTDTTEPSES